MNCAYCNRFCDMRPIRYEAVCWLCNSERFATPKWLRGFSWWIRRKYFQTMKAGAEEGGGKMSYAPILVVAGSHRQAVYWMNQEYPGLSRKEWRYAKHPRDILGYRGPAIKFVGTWWESIDEEFIANFRSRLAPGQTLTIEAAQ